MRAVPRPASDYERPDLRRLTAAEYIACILEARPCPARAATPPAWSAATVGEGIARIVGMGARG